MHLEWKCELNGVCIKKISLFTDKQKTYVQVLELREDTLGKSGWLPVHFSTHDRYESAKMKFLGYTAATAFENANQSHETDRENLFIRGSLPSSLGRGIKQA